MQGSAKASSDQNNLENLKTLSILNPSINNIFKRISRVTQKLFDVPTVVFCFVETERKWLKSVLGLAINEKDRHLSFCTQAIDENKTLILNDVLNDKRFKDNPLVLKDPNIRFYASHPIQSIDGNCLGALCIMDTKPRKFEEEELNYLQYMADFVNDAIQIQKGNMAQVDLLDDTEELKKDSLTQVWNRDAIEHILKKRTIISHAHNQPFGLALIDLDDFKFMSEQYGKDAGNLILKKVTDAAIDFFRDEDVIGRWGYDTFLIICATSKSTELESIGQRLTELIRNLIIRYEGDLLNVSGTVGLLNVSSVSDLEIDVLIEEVHAALFAGKEQGKNTYVVSEYIENQE